MRFFTLAVTSTITLASMSASAQSPEAEGIAAAQFDRALAAMSAGDFAEACPALAESYRLDPKAGALFTLAECEAKWGRVASAYGHYADYLAWFARMTVDERRLQVGRDRISEQARGELKPRIPLLTVSVTTALPPHAVVKRDGVVLGIPSLDVPLPVDPGVHVVVLELPGTGVTQRAITLEQGASEHVSLDLPVAVQAKPVETTKVVQERRPLLPRIAPYVAAGVGVAGIGVGTAFGLVAMSKTSLIAEHCSGAECDRAGLAAADSAQSAATVSTIGFGVGVVGLGAGVLLHLLRPRATTSVSAVPSVGRSAQGMGIGGTF